VSEKGSLHPLSSILVSGTACGVRFMACWDLPRLFEWGLEVYKGYSRLFWLQVCFVVKKFL